MASAILNKIFGRVESRPDLDLASRLEKLLRDIGKPRVLNPSKFFLAKEVQKSIAPTLLTIPFENQNEFAIVWAQNRVPYGLMLFAQSKWPNIDYDLWAYTREKYRGLNIAKLTLAEGVRQLALEKKESVLTAEILIHDERTRKGSVRWLNSLGFIASQTDSVSDYRRLYMAAYTKEVLETALRALPGEYQEQTKKMSPLPPDILTDFSNALKDSYHQGGRQLIERKRSV
jgi:hypothetical protein